jgi:hypothetical protein
MLSDDVNVTIGVIQRIEGFLAEKIKEVIQLNSEFLVGIATLHDP